VARRSWPAEKRRVDTRRKVRREIRWGGFVLGDVGEWEGEGERRSARKPVASRARVEQSATIETCKAGAPFGGEAGGG